MRFRSFPNPKARVFSIRSLLMLVPPAVCYGLGYWQIQRRKWKLDLIEKLDREISLPPIPLPASARSSKDLPEYKCVSVRGHYDHTREVLIGLRNRIDDLLPDPASLANWFPTEQKLTRGTAAAVGGYFVVTPFILDGTPEDTILVNRGWVPEMNRDPSTREAGQVRGTTEVTGYIRYPEEPPYLASNPRVLACNSAEVQHMQLTYICRHVARLAQDLETLPLFIDAKFDPTLVGGPIGGQTRVQVRNQHMSYIVTCSKCDTSVRDAFISQQFIQIMSSDHVHLLIA